MDPWNQENNSNGGKDGRKNCASRNGCGWDKFAMWDLWENMLRGYHNRKRGHRYIYTIIFMIICVYMTTGFYIVDPGEQSLQLLCGRYVNTQADGLHYWWPQPIGTVHKIRIDAVQRENLGDADDDTRRKQSTEYVMLTGDENIVNVSFDVQWKIADGFAYVFNVRERRTGENVRDAAESAIREMLGKWSLVDALEGEGRYRIALEVRDVVQRILDGYNAGIEILSVQLKKIDPPVKVLGAFRDVQSARADKVRLVNEAQSYKNEVLPKAKGDSLRIVLDAEAYKSEVVNKALGETAKFLSLYNEYVGYPVSVRRRLYLETMEEVLSPMEKTIITGEVGGLLTHLPVLDKWGSGNKVITRD